jgi:hypothetical protein
MDELDELAKTVAELQRFLRVANDRILRLEERVAKLVASSPNSHTIHGAPNSGSPLGKSLGEMTTTDYPVRLPRQPE